MADKGKFAKWTRLVGTAAESVINFYDPTTALPSAPTLGDRYIASATGNGWTANYVYEWSGAAWTETSSISDLQVYVAERSADFWFDGSAWVVLQRTIKRGRQAYVANTPTPRAAEWQGEDINRHTTRSGRNDWADWRPNEEVIDSSSSAEGSSSEEAMSSESSSSMSSESSSSMSSE